MKTGDIQISYFPIVNSRKSYFTQLSYNLGLLIPIPKHNNEHTNEFDLPSGTLQGF
jgi:hypothetical protein